MHKVRNIFLFILGAVVIVVGVMFVSLLFKKPQMSHNFTATAQDGSVFSLHDNVGVKSTALIFIDPQVEGSNDVFSKLLTQKDNIDIVAVSVSALSKEEQLKLLPEGGATLSKLCFDSDAVEIYNIGNAPVLYFIDKEGYVQKAFIGSVKQSSIDKQVASLNK